MTKTVLLAVSGSIAAYKAADLTNQFTKAGLNVRILMTPAATQFITPLTLQVLSKNPVTLDMIKEEDAQTINHIDLAKEADVFLIAPASANTIAKLSYGMADNIVTTTALALPADTPKLIAPAMNTNMYNNPMTKRNIEQLIQAGYQKIEPRSTRLACGDVGKGALADLETIIESVLKVCKNHE